MKRVVIILLFLILLNVFLVSGIFTPSIPTSCSESRIDSTWSSIFKTSSGSIIILTNTTETGKCNAFYAYKIQGNIVYILAGKDFNNNTKISALHANATSSYIDSINITSIKANDDMATFLLASFNPSTDFQARNINITQADTDFREIFEPIPNPWFIVPNTYPTIYLSTDSDNSTGNDKSLNEVVMGNYTAEWIIFTQISSPACIENWTCGYWSACINNSQNKTCSDLNNCNTTINKPAISQSCNLTLCTPLWNCTAWTACADNVQTRNCKDLHNCRITVNNTKNEIQVCNSTEVCVPDWECEDWPEKCPEVGERQRTCQDNNNCNSNKIEKQACEFKSSMPLVITISIIIIVIAAVAGIIIFKLRKQTEYTEIKFPDTGQFGQQPSSYPQ